MSRCVVVSCTNKVGEAHGKTFHRFPTWNPELFELWSRRIRPKEYWKTTPVICSDHFEESCFDMIGDVKHIRAGAIPTLFYPETKQQNENEEVTEKPQIINVMSLVPSLWTDSSNQQMSPSLSQDQGEPIMSSIDSHFPKMNIPNTLDGSKVPCDASCGEMDSDSQAMADDQTALNDLVGLAATSSHLEAGVEFASDEDSSSGQLCTTTKEEGDNLSPLNNETDPLQLFRKKIKEICKRKKAQEKKNVMMQLLLSFKRFSVNQQKIKIALNRQRLLRRKMMQTAMIMILLTQQEAEINS